MTKKYLSKVCIKCTPKHRVKQFILLLEIGTAQQQINFIMLICCDVKTLHFQRSIVIKDEIVSHTISFVNRTIRCITHLILCTILCVFRGLRSENGIHGGTKTNCTVHLSHLRNRISFKTTNKSQRYIRKHDL